VLNFEWNALRTGDEVRVHDPRSPDLALVSGVVTMVDAKKGPNGVGIRVAGRTGSAGNAGRADDGAVLWLVPQAVHRATRNPNEPCWRCQALAEPASQSA
jgi:hypothetical protein